MLPGGGLYGGILAGAGPTLGLWSGRGQSVTWQTWEALTNTERLGTLGDDSLGSLGSLGLSEDWGLIREPGEEREAKSSGRKGERRGSNACFSMVRFLIMRLPSRTTAMTSTLAEEGTSSGGLFRLSTRYGRIMRRRADRSATRVLPNRKACGLVLRSKGAVGGLGQNVEHLNAQVVPIYYLPVEILYCSGSRRLRGYKIAWVTVWSVVLGVNQGCGREK